MNPPDQLISRKQACAMLGISLRSLLRIEASGLLTPIKLTGKQHSLVRYRLSEVLELIERRSQTSCLKRNEPAS